MLVQFLYCGMWPSSAVSVCLCVRPFSHPTSSPLLPNFPTKLSSCFGIFRLDCIGVPLLLVFQLVLRLPVLQLTLPATHYYVCAFHSITFSSILHMQVFYMRYTYIYLYVFFSYFSQHLFYRPYQASSSLLFVSLTVLIIQVIFSILEKNVFSFNVPNSTTC